MYIDLYRSNSRERLVFHLEFYLQSFKPNFPTNQILLNISISTRNLCLKGIQMYSRLKRLEWRIRYHNLFHMLVGESGDDILKNLNFPMLINIFPWNDLWSNLKKKMGRISTPLFSSFTAFLATLLSGFI